MLYFCFLRFDVYYCLRLVYNAAGRVAVCRPTILFQINKNNLHIQNNMNTFYILLFCYSIFCLHYYVYNWHRLVKNIEEQTQIRGGKNVEKTINCMGVSQLLGERVPGMPPMMPMMSTV